MDHFNEMPMHTAVLTCDVTIFDKVIEQKNITEVNILNQTVLHLGVIHEQPEIVSIILKINSSSQLINNQYTAGRTASHYAAENSTHEISDKLLEVGAFTTVYDKLIQKIQREIE